MGGLGNVRRGGRSPPLMIGALIACILVLGFNYWVSSSRNVELETKLYELEGQVQRGAAERGVVELKKTEFQVEIQRQTEQISHIESLYKRQLEGSQNTCSQEKGTLLQNISSSTKSIQEHKGQVNQLNDDLGKVQKELQSCQGNIKNLNNRLTYDMTHCQSQVLSQKELCDERVAAAKLEVQKKMEKLITPSGVSSKSEHAVAEASKEDGGVTTGADAVKTETLEGNTTLSQPNEEDPSELLTNEIVVDKGPNTPVDLPTGKDLSKIYSQSIPSAAAVKQETLLPPEGVVLPQEAEAETSEPVKNNLTEDKEMEVMDVHREDTQTEEADPVMDGMLMNRVKVEDAPLSQKPEEPEDYDADEQVVGGVDLEKQRRSKLAENIDKDMEEELADYNGDDENEGEFEADKQAELAQT
ncbi:Golgi membrane protein 1 [Pseudochaenichthys georgianus]|uniref:Golgi membrane protein 1 n=1 Tax=Pseudochaenichthys georgianus TaxID=52239 RepID=UPI00146CF507|nr:Golgi membrane protein 1 [Pseudochaenichthys georgianus]XP_033946912.1 Golgi membrane protein 1 [Pseudochaenichthys georgianus]